MQQSSTMTATGSPDSKVHGANMGPTCMSQMGPMNLAIRIDDDWSQGINSIDTDLVRRAYPTIRTRSIGKVAYVLYDYTTTWQKIHVLTSKIINDCVGLMRKLKHIVGIETNWHKHIVQI